MAIALEKRALLLHTCEIQNRTAHHLKCRFPKSAFAMNMNVGGRFLGEKSKEGAVLDPSYNC